ncbi:unnamed protein product [Trichobilharzia szidati]|nr:unnamed protein product [Trichobilharzia szidati]
MNICSIFNMQTPGEHSSCGYGVLSSGFSYEPSQFMQRNIFFYNFSWCDYGVASLSFILDTVVVIQFSILKGKVAIHCYAGLGRTGVIIACYLVFNNRISAGEAIRDSPWDSLEMILLQVVLPLLLDVQAKASLRQLLRWWCVSVAWLLGLRSYLLGDVPFSPGDFIVTENGREVPFKPGQYPRNEAQTSSNRANEELNPVHSSQTTSNNEARNLQAELYTVVSSSNEGNSSANNPSHEHVQPEVDAQDDGYTDEEDFTRYVPYKKASCLKLRIFSLIILSLISLMSLSLA